jgi:hypothetical protein
VDGGFASDFPHDADQAGVLVDLFGELAAGAAE